MPVLAIGGEASYGDHVAEAMAALADDVQSVVIPGAGHWVAEEAPDEMLAALTAFLAPYRDGRATVSSPGECRTCTVASAGRPSGSTPSRSAPPSCAGTSSWSTSGR